MSTEGTAEPPGASCELVYAFMDGELLEPQADHFRHHLARCERCAQRLSDGWFLEERRRRLKPARAPALAPSPWLRWMPVATLFAGAGAAIAVVMAIQHAPALPGGRSPAVAAAPPRRAKARVSGSGASPYAKLDQGPVFLGTRKEGSAPVMSAAELRALADRISALEARGDYLGAANTYVEWGRAEQASQYLPRIPRGPDRDVLEAAIALEENAAAADHTSQAERALEAADRALRQQPQLGPALWNRALALGQLSLPAAAHHALEQVAQAGEDGWAAEAEADSRAWQARLQERHDRYLAADRACRQMIEAGAPMPESLARDVPGLARACLYKAVQAAPSEEQVRRLLPLAQQLDALDGGDVLVRYVGAVARKSFAARRPMAELYRRLALRESLSTAEVEALLETLRKSGEPDILLGALGDVPLELVLPAAPRYRQALADAAKSTQDPWWVLLSAEQQGLGERQEGQVERAIATLLPAAGDCGPHKPARAMDIRCAGLRRQLGRAYALMNRTAEARQQTQLALDLAGLQSDWGTEIKILTELAMSDRQGGHTALALAYYDEVVQREPGGCRAPTLLVERAVDWDFVYSNLAQTHMRVLDFAAARKDLEEARHCKNARAPQRFGDQADLARIYPPTPEEVREFETLLAGVAATQSPGGKVQALAIRGRFQLEVDPALGGSLLRQAIREAERLPDDWAARRARSWSYTSLILAAGKNRRYDEALELFAEEKAIPAPRSCALAVAVDDERTLVLVRGSGGTTRGAYDASRRQPLESAEGLVPRELLAELQGCATVRVIARPPLVGMENLVPDDIAWGYLGQRAAVEAPASGEESLLLVTRPIPPPELGLDDIGAISAPPAAAGMRVVELKDGDATPDRVLKAMEDASVIYLHAHGVLKDSADPAFLALSQDPQSKGKYALTVADIRARQLKRRPAVVLIACDAAHTGPYLHQVFDLPSAFLEAGARLVFAARAPIPNEQASPFFAQLLEDVRQGKDPAVALRNAKRRWAPTAPWVEHVLLFQASAD